MKAFKKVAALLLVVALLATSLVSCGKKSIVDEIKKSGKLTVITEPGFAPFEYIDANGEIAGVDIEIAKKIAEKLGVEAEITAMDFDAIIPAIQAGKANLGAAGITATEERAKSVDFSVNYVDTGLYIIVPEGSAIAGAADIVEGTAVGVQLGTTSDMLVSDITSGISRYKTVADAVVALQSGKIEAVVADELPAKDAVTNNTGLVLLEEPLSVEQYALAITKGNEELLEVINEVLGEMIESGEVDKLIQEHMELAAAVG